ncbi:hypothetical protein TNCV_1847181 [Trichonephila clavipes]|nr:hypothetical protein TNCV_1847181 [Trichonephila clavipes]
MALPGSSFTPTPLGHEDNLEQSHPFESTGLDFAGPLTTKCAHERNPSDYNTLTPAHFLVGGPIHQIPKPSQPTRSVDFSERGNLIQRLHRHHCYVEIGLIPMPSQMEELSPLRKVQRSEHFYLELCVSTSKLPCLHLLRHMYFNVLDKNSVNHNYEAYLDFL